MLKLKASPTFKAKVSVTVQGGEKHVLDIEFKHMRKDAADDHFKKDDMSLAEKMLAVIASWSGIEAELSVAGMLEIDQEYPSLLPQLVAAYVDNLALGRSGN
ncbi:MAG TPA: phage tail assembly chaperone [Burkholderiaceae bacterium]